MVFPVVIYGYESWMIRKAKYWRTDAFELWCWKRLMNCKEIQPAHPKGDQSWISTGGTDAEAETPILWPPDAESWLVGKDPDAGKDWKQEEKGMMEDEMFVWHHQLNGHEFEQTPGDGDEQGSLVCCRLWGHKESDMTEWLNWTVTWKVLRKAEIKGEIRCFLLPLFSFQDTKNWEGPVWSKQHENDDKCVLTYSVDRILLKKCKEWCSLGSKSPAFPGDNVQPGSYMCAMCWKFGNSQMRNKNL